jgi:succinate-acetate transporter protein
VSLFFGGLFYLVFEKLRLFDIELDDINKHPMAVGVFLFCYEVFLGLIMFASLTVPIG